MTINRIGMAAMVTAIAGVFSTGETVRGQDLSIRLDKPENVFFYSQLNLQWGLDSAEPDDWGWSDRGARTQVDFEWFGKSEARMQKGYTESLEPTAWNIKFAIEADPNESNGDLEPQFRLLDTWLKIDTKWDRTALWVGHKSLAYGHNPRMDPTHSFLPNQAGLDLSFGRDTGVFGKTPLSAEHDLEVSLTAGMGDTLDYHGGWLGLARIGTPTFEADEIGYFALVGRIQGTSGARTVSQDLKRLYRIGVDWVHKESEDWKSVVQLSFGENSGGSAEDRFVFNMLASFESYADPDLTVGVSHALRYEELIGLTSGAQTTATVYGSLSFALDRDTRFRISPFVEYYDSTGKRDAGVFFQLCFGCGLTK